jgi:hypothetical protein
VVNWWEDLHDFFAGLWPPNGKAGARAGRRVAIAAAPFSPIPHSSPDPSAKVVDISDVFQADADAPSTLPRLACGAKIHILRALLVFEKQRWE